MMSMNEKVLEDPTESLEVLMNTYFDKEKAMELVRKKANPDTKDLFGLYLLHLLAALENTNDEIRELVQDFHADINCKDAEGLTPLHHVLSRSNLSCDDVMLFAELKADFNVIDKDGNSVIVILSLLDFQKFNDLIYQLILDHDAKIITANSSRIDSTQITVKKHIGAGGYAQVFLGDWNNQPVAIKSFTIRQNNIAKQIKNYCQEIKILNLLTNTPNIIEFKGHNQTGQYHIVLEYAEKGSLENIIKLNPDTLMSWNLRYEMAIGILTGLNGMHEKAILHRDLKSANILVCENNLPKIADFGTSTIKKMRYRDQAGTLIYMAPETLFVPLYSEQSDIYSYSRILIELAYLQILRSYLPRDFQRTLRETLDRNNKNLRRDKDHMRNIYRQLKLFSKPPMPTDCPDHFTLFARPCMEYRPEKRPHADELLASVKHKPGSI